MQSRGDAPCLARPCWRLDWGIKAACILRSCFAVFSLTGVLNCTEQAPAAQNGWDVPKNQRRTKFPGDWLVMVCFAGALALVGYGGHGADISTLGDCSGPGQDPPSAVT